MKARTILISAIAAVVLLAPILLVAQGHPGGHGSRGDRALGADGLLFFERLLPRMAERLNLADEQVAQIEEILDRELPSIRASVEELATAREAYHQEHDRADFDEAAFREFVESQMWTEVELRVTVARTHAAIYQVLTPEQREQIGEMRGHLDHQTSRRHKPTGR